MATHHAVQGVLGALAETLTEGLAHLPHKPDVQVLGADSLAHGPHTHQLGIYLYRIAVDPFSRSVTGNSSGRNEIAGQRPDLAVTLHVLLLGWSPDPQMEMSSLAAAMQALGHGITLGCEAMASRDPGWESEETVQIIPEEMNSETLLRLWNTLPGPHRLSVPYLIRNLRLHAVDCQPATTSFLNMG
jgi:Pvc16 N-terminal domain